MDNFERMIPCPCCCGVGCDGKSRECEACDGSGFIYINLPSGVAVVALIPGQRSGPALIS